jgi:hypothetical protein
MSYAVFSRPKKCPRQLFSVPELWQIFEKARNNLVATGEFSIEARNISARILAESANKINGLGTKQHYVTRINALSEEQRKELGLTKKNEQVSC